MLAENLYHESRLLARRIDRRASHENHIDSFAHYAINFFTHGQKYFRRGYVVTDPATLHIVLQKVESTHKLAADEELREGVPTAVLFQDLAEV